MNLISCQLTFIHIMMILSEGDNLLSNIIDSLKLGNDIKCKTTFYKNRVMKELSICTTCLLSVFQAVTISLSTSLLANFKHKVKTHIIYTFSCLWSLNLTFSTRLIFYVADFTNVIPT
jgi:vomeronasal1 receptor